MRIRSPFAAPESNPAFNTLFFLLIAITAIGIWFIAANLPVGHPLYEFETGDVFGSVLLLEGQNPYSLASHPTYLYSYGIVPTLLATPVAALCHTSFGVHRALSVLSLVLACAVLFHAIRLSGGRPSFAAVGALLLFIQHAFSTGITAKPGFLGLLFFLLGAGVPLAGGFRRFPVLLGLLCGLLGFYTKLYFVLVAPALVLYLFLFRSKREGLLAGLCLALLLLGSAALVDALFPLYFTDTFFVLYNFGIGNASVSHLAQTVGIASKRDCGLLLLLIWGAWRGVPGAPFLPARWRLDFRDLDRPLLADFDLPFPFVLFVAIGIVYLFVFGLNPGGGTDYIYQLLLPFLIWQAAVIASQAPQAESRPGLRLPTLLILSVVLFMACLPVPKRIVPFLRHREAQAAAWRHVDAIVASHRDILNDLYFGIQLRNAGRPVYNGGQAAAYPLSFAHNPSAIVPAYRERCREWQEAIDQKIRGRRFDAVLTSFPDPSIAPPDLLARYYRPVESFPLVMTFVTPTVTLWEPREDAPASAAP